MSQIEVEVIYALPLGADRSRLLLPEGTSVGDAITQSGVLERFPEIDLSRTRVGIYGRWVALDAILRDRDRVEIYRPLVADPKEVRRARARRRSDAGTAPKE